MQMQQKPFLLSLGMLLLGLLLKSPARGTLVFFLVSFSDFMCSKPKKNFLYALQLALLVCICSFLERLFRHALEDSRPKSVLVHSLSVCISLLDPKRLTTSFYHSFRCRTSHTSVAAANPETVEGMLESLGKITASVSSLLNDRSLGHSSTFPNKAQGSSIMYGAQQGRGFLKMRFMC